MDLETGRESPLVTDEAFDHSPRWSPDGTMLAFHSARSGNGDIWLLSLADGTLRRLTTSDAFDHFPTWSPDGTRIAFGSDRAGTEDLWVLRLAGPQERGPKKGPAP